MKKIIVLVLGLFCWSMEVMAQFQGAIYQQSVEAVVNVGTNSLLSSWCGGINSIQINHADINNDGKLDLVLYDNNSEVVRTLINVGNANEIKYSYQPQYEINFKDADSYMILKDYNCDGVVDMFCKGLPGVTVYKGYYQGNVLKFTLYKSLWYPTTNGLVNVYVQNTDIPSIEDVDGDGDLDIYSYELNGFYLTYYKNLRVEDGLPCDSIRMIQADKCWGKFYQGVNREVITNITCKGGDGQNKKYRHPKNTVLHLDIDHDGDWDILNGNVAYTDVQLYLNNGNNIINAQDTLYNSSGHQLKMPSWPASFLSDIDNDGDKDLLFTAHSDDLNTANYNTIAWYKNMGSSSIPVYTYVTDTLLTPDMIDVGSFSYPSFYDYDKDGKPDLFVGTQGYYDNNSDTMVCKMAYYRNTSVGSQISFDFITNDFLNLSAKNYKGIFPAFGDITGDDIDDLVMGNVKGSFVLYKNMAASNAVQPDFQWITDSIAIPSPGKYATPCIYDFNEDGKNDLISGNEIGTLAYYKDTSINSTTHLKLITTNLGNVKAIDISVFASYSAPIVTKMDNTNKLFLLLGNAYGTVERYDSFRNNLASFKRIDSNYSYIQTPYRSAPAVADLNNDGKYDMVVGNKLGGLLLYKQSSDVGIADQEQRNLAVLMYPNPCHDYVNLLFTQPVLSKVTARIYDILGHQVLQQELPSSQTTIDVRALVKGFYVIDLETNNERRSFKLIVN